MAAQADRMAPRPEQVAPQAERTKPQAERATQARTAGLPSSLLVPPRVATGQPVATVARGVPLLRRPY